MKKLVEKLEAAKPLGVCVLRVTAGTSMIVLHGWGKLQDPEPFVTGGAMESFPMPTILGWAAIGAESLGAALLAVGLLTRLAAFSVLATMAGAAFVVHAGDSYASRELALIYGAIALFFVFHGGGRLSLDRIVGRRRSGKAG